MKDGAERDSVATPAAEAARYALLRRLAPSMRHHLVVNLQPIGMVHEIITLESQSIRGLARGRWEGGPRQVSTSP